MTFKQWLSRTFAPRARRAAPFRSTPRVEPLEDRLAPAVLVVNSGADNETTGDSLLTLREAIRSVGQGSLRDSSASAQVTGAFGSGDTIQFASSLDGQSVVLTSAGSTAAGPSAFGITTPLVIDGETGLSQGITLERNGGALFRFFYVSPTGNLTLKGLTVRGGEARGWHGAGGNGAAGGGAAGLGGAVFNQGSLTLLDSTLTGNTARGGAGGSPSYGTFDQTKPGNGGGGLNGPGRTGYNSDGGHGGGPNAGSGGVLDHISGYAGGFGGGGGGGFGLFLLVFRVGVGAAGGFGGGGGGGGSDQFSGKYRGGYGGNGGFGGGGGGAGRDNTLRGTNLTTPGSSLYGGGAGLLRAGGGGAGMGGAVFNHAGTVVVTSSTIAGNAAVGGLGGLSFPGRPDADPGKGLGGGLFNYNGTVTVTNGTISGNTAAQGGRGILSIRDGATPARLVLNNTIIGQADAAGSDLVVKVINSGVSDPAAVSGTANLIRTIDGPTALTGTVTADPLLGPLQENGGLTPTLAFPAGSPADDGGAFFAAPTADQRGLSRGARPDIGAYELRQAYSAVVNTAADETTTGGTLSLREALKLADDVIDLDDLTAAERLQVVPVAGTTNTIRFAADLSGATVTLTTVGGTRVGPSAFQVGSPVVIDGLAGAGGVTLSAGGSMRHFDVTPGGNLTLKSLTLTGGFAQGTNGGDGGDGRGGAVYNQGRLTVLASLLTGNTARGGFGASGGLAGGDGGDGRGGAVFNDGGSATVANSTLYDNAAVGRAGGTGFFSDGADGRGQGGALFNNNGTITVTGSTITGNRVTQGDGSLLGAAGRGIYNLAPFAGSAFVSSTIIGQADTDIEDFSGSVGGPGSNYAGGSFNLIRRMSGFGDAALTGDPKLDPLADNGGPTRTTALRADSPVIDKGSTFGAAPTDQRGVPRPVYKADMGAFERTGVNYVVNTALDETTDPATLSLREAIGLSNGSLAFNALSAAERNQITGAATDTIDFDPVVHGRTITLTSVGDTSVGPAAFRIVSTVAINGPDGDSGVTLSAAGSVMRLFTVTAGGSLTLRNLTLEGGTARGVSDIFGIGGPGRGGAVYNQGTLKVFGSTFTGNSALGSSGATGANGEGGAVYNTGTTTVTNSTFTGNAAVGGSGFPIAGRGLGGALFTSAGNLAIYHSTLSGNTAAEGGRGVFSANGSVSLNTSVLGQGDTAVTDLVVVGSQALINGGPNLIRTMSLGAGVNNLLFSTTTGDPRLDPLADNGGPTRTMAPQVGSPLVGAIAFTDVKTDQRGVSRALPADLGAFETRPTFNLVVTTAADANVRDTALSLREAVELANGSLAWSSLTTGEKALAVPVVAAANRVTFADSLNGGTVTITATADTTFGPSAFVVGSRIVIDGRSSGGGVTLSAAGGSLRPFIVTASGDLTLQNLTLRDGTARGYDGGDARFGNGGGGSAGFGGAVFNLGTLRLLNSTLTGNTARGGDGGVNDSSIGADDTARGGGGGAGVSADGARPPSDAANVNEGGAGGNARFGFGEGGFAAAPNGRAGINTAVYGGGGGGGGFGGGIFGGSGAGGAGGFGGGGGGAGFNYGNGGAGGFGGGGGGATGQFFSGGAGGYGGAPGRSFGGSGLGGGGGAGLGGAVFNQGGTVVVTNSTFTGNAAVGGSGGARGVGGGVFNYNGTLTVTSSTFSGNTADAGRGVVVFADGSEKVADAEIHNSVLGQGDTAASDLVVNRINGGVFGNTATVDGVANLVRVKVALNGATEALAGTLTADPQLGALAANGGPTPTLALAFGSAAINAGLGTAPADQRGAARVGAADLGAYEFDRQVSVAVSQPAVAEDAGAGLVFTFTRNGDVSLPVTVTFASAGSASQASDYTATSSDPAFTLAGGVGTVRFAAGATTATVTLTPTTDATVEGNETVSLTPTGAAGYIVNAVAAAGTITNDDAGVSVSVAPGTVAEDGAAPLVYTFTRTGFTADALTAAFVVGGSAALGTDYAQAGAASFTAAGGTVTFAAGVTTATITLTPVADATEEGNETAILTVTGGPGYSAVGTEATGTIRNDDTTVTVAVDAVAVAEGGADVVYTFTRSGDTAGALTVSFGVGGLAAFGSDYAQAGAATFTAAGGTVTFAAGATTATVTVTPAADATDEPDEDVTLTVTGGLGYTVGAEAEATTTITDDDDAPTFSVADVTVSEAAGTVTFTVTRTGATAFATSVDFATAAGTATDAAGGPGTPDFTATSGTLSFAASAAASETRTFTVALTTDAVHEVSEQFVVTLTNAVNATIADDQGAATILDDDAAPVLSIGDVTVNEAAGTVTLTVTLTGATALPVTVDYATADGTAVSAGSGPGTPDFAAGGGTLTFDPSAAASRTRTIVVPIADDATAELAEQFAVTLSGATNATVSRARGAVTIGDDDPAPSLSIDDVTLAEGAAGATAFTFTVTLSAPSGAPVTVAYATADGTAAAGPDYAAAGGTLTFAPGETSKTVTVLVTGDATYETDETVVVTLTTPTNASLAAAVGTGTVANDDAFPVVTLSAAGGVFSENGGKATVTATLANPSAFPVTVDLAFSGAGGYVASANRIVIPAGSLTGFVTLTGVDDARDENDESVVVSVAAVTGGTGAPTVSLTLTDDDLPAAAADALTTSEDTLLSVAAPGLRGNDNAAPGSTVELVGPGTANGTLTLNPDGSLTYAPAADFQGSDSFRYLVRNAAGEASAPVTVTLTVTAVNDPPTFTPGPSQTTGRGGDAVVVPGWATGISAGPADESGQTLAFRVTTDNPGLFAVAPAIDPATGTLTFTPTATGFGTATVTVQLTDGGGGASAARAFTITVTRHATGSDRPVNQGEFARFVVGTGDGGPGTATVHAPDGSVVAATTPFGPGVAVRAVLADVTGDGTPELIAASGRGVPGRLLVTDPTTGGTVLSVFPFGRGFTGGVFVAAGDVNADGFADVVVSADVGGGARVVVYDGKTRQAVASFLGIDDAKFRGGARVAVGDVNGDGVSDLVVTAGFGGGPRVAVFDGTSVGGPGGPRRLMNDFFAFEQALRDGAYAAVGDVDGDGFGDLVFGGGPGGAPRVLVLSGADLLAGAGGAARPLANFFAGDAATRAGERVAVTDLDGDRYADVVAGAAAAGRVAGYAGKNFAGGSAPEAFAFDALTGMTDGVYVG